MGRVLRSALVVGFVFSVLIAPRPADDRTALAAPVAYPAMEWLQATTSNYEFGRAGNPINTVVIHYTAISFARTLTAFRNPRSRVSAHYVVSGIGQIVQMVPESDTAWQAGNVLYNRRSIGIELELDDVTNPAFTTEQYHKAARLVCAIASRYGFPLTRRHIIGHNEVPGAGKIDPGPTWNWPHFMWLTSQCADPRTVPNMFHSRWVTQSGPTPITVGSTATATVTLRNAGTRSWVKGSDTEARLGIPGDDVRASAYGVPFAWVHASRPAAQAEAVVPPGGLATFTFKVSAWTPGTYRLRLRPVIDGTAWMEDQGIYVDVVAR